MIYYILIALLLVTYLEITGQYFLHKLNVNNFKFGFGVGFLCLMAYCYVTTSIITSLNCSFYLVLGIYFIYFLGSLIMIVKDFKKIKWKFDYKWWALCLLFVGMLIYYAYNTTLGDSNGFDTSFYLNLISTNVGNSKLNSINLYNGGEGGWFDPQYAFQSYYYFVSCACWVFVKVLSHFTNISTYLITIWVFQILFDFFFFGLLADSINIISKNKRYLSIVLIFIFLFFYGKLYYNNVFGWFGNTFRTIGSSYTILATYLLLKDNNKENWIILLMFMNAQCAFSSTSLFIIIFILFGLYFVEVDKENNLFRYYAIGLLFPLINLLKAAFISNLFLSIVISIIICLLLYFSNNLLVRISRFKYSRKIILIISALAMLALSYRTTHNIFDFDAFFNNNSSNADMVINYFDINLNTITSQTIYCIFVLLLLVYSLIFEYKNRLIMLFWILIIVVFNPFMCSFINSINVVYYRAYEIIINPFTITLMFTIIFERYKNKILYYLLVSIVLASFALNITYITPNYYHKTFVPSDNYNNLSKMENGEYETLYWLNSYIKNKNDKYPLIIHSNVLTESVIPNGSYLFSRTHGYSGTCDGNKEQIYCIFTPNEYQYLYEGVKLNYDNIGAYLKDLKTKYLIVNNNEEYYDENLGSYSYLYLKVYDEIYKDTLGEVIYSNNDFTLFEIY